MDAVRVLITKSANDLAVAIAEHVAGKRLRALAVGTKERHPDFPGVPTMAEEGFPGFEDTAPWVGLLAPVAVRSQDQR